MAIEKQSTAQAMTRYERWSLVIQVVGFGVAFLGLWFIFVGTSSASKQASLNAYEIAAGQMSAIDNIFVQYPELYPYFYEGRPLARDDPSYGRGRAVAMAVSNFLEATLPREGSSTLPWWDKYMEDQFALSPILCEYLESRHDWFDPRLIKAMRQTRGRGRLSPLGRSIQ
jgi:hypothetical protein